MQATPARRTFKALAGSTNHLLITTLVGLDAVRDGTADLSPTFATSWNPQSRSRSADRGKDFIIKASVSWLVDAVDAYTRRLNRRPFLIQSAADRSSLDEAGRSIDRRLTVLGHQFDITGTTSYCMARLTVAWRNKLVHFEAENDIDDAVRRTLLDASDEVRHSFQGLDIARLLANFDAGKAPTFKECSAMVRAMQLLVEDLDALVLQALDAKTYLADVLGTYVNSHGGQNGRSDREPHRFIANIWGKDPSRRDRSLRQLARQHGFGDGDGGARLEDADFDEWSRLSHREAASRLLRQSDLDVV